MASIPYFVLSPSAILCLVGLAYGPDKTVSPPSKEYGQITIDLVIPAYNEEKTIVLCLQSVALQTIKPQRIFLVDDGSTDRTSQYAKKFSEFVGLDITLIRREKPEGKTASLKMAARDSQADVLFVLDADTILRSENYIEVLVKALFQGIGIASACGVVSPQIEGDRERLISTPAITHFTKEFPEVIGLKGEYRFLQTLINYYRQELYFFLQQFIYHGEMVFFGSIINPVGCAVAYRREHLNELLEHYAISHGSNLTTSEDIFIGFAFDNLGYRNIQVQDVFALTREPRVERFPKQIMLWSSSFLQSCYYFDALVRTPLKSPLVLYRYLKYKIVAKRLGRKIEEAYQQEFGEEITNKYGRPIGWFIFTSLFDKISFPTILIILIMLQKWEILFFTLLIEVSIYTSVITLLHKHKHIKNALKCIFYTPFRYSVILFDIFVIANFVKDIWITRNRKWKK